jgi:hypothetical protein
MQVQNSLSECILRKNKVRVEEQEVLFCKSTFKLKQTPWPESASELNRPSDRRLPAKIVPTFADRGDTWSA